MSARPYRDVLDQALRRRLPAGVNLLPGVSAQFAKGRLAARTRTRLSVGIVIVLIALVVALLAVPGVAIALRHLFGYIPGVGLVEPGGTLRILAKPVSVTRAGTTVTVEKGIADTHRTILRIFVKGTNADGGPDCADANSRQLRLADGTKLEETSEYDNIGDLNKPGYTDLVVFPALPSGTDDVMLKLPCLWQVSGLNDWKLGLHFTPGEDAGFNPVIEIPPATPTGQVPQPAKSPYGIALVLERVVVLDDGYLLMGSMHWDDPSVQVGDRPVRLVDANGQELKLEDAEYTAPDLAPDAGALSAPWAYKVSGRQHAWPLKLTMDADVSTNVDVPFTFDPGPAPHPGQSWTLDQDMTIKGFPLRLLSATLDANQTLILSMKLSPDLWDASFIDKSYLTANPRDKHPADLGICGGGGGGGGGGSNQPIYQTSFGYCTGRPLPPGPRVLTIDSIGFIVHGNWQVTWQP